VKACKLAGVDASYCEINSTYGHDSFLLEIEQEAQLISHFLYGVEKGNYDVKVNIKTNDEIEELGHAFNTTTAALAKLDEERIEIDNAKTEFLSITSHELRSPMTPMKAQPQMLENEYFGKLTKEQKDSLAIVIRNADRLDKIISDFLEISRIESTFLSIRDSNVHQLAEEI
jgi:signal transduction histidine kinase